MGLNKSKGNMYPWITNTWNVIKGECPHDCSYCYMKKWGKLNPVRFDEKELKTDLGKDKFIFVGSSCDMFAEDISDEWIQRVIDHCKKFKSQYLFQTKCPYRLGDFDLPKNSIICTTIETNRVYSKVMMNSPNPINRAYGMFQSNLDNFKKYVTIEPIMDFDLKEMVKIIEYCEPIQVNIGADSGNNKLPEPSKEKILQLIQKLESFTKVKQKSNLKRLL